ncbi:NADH dehydrogenase [Formosa sp. Hel1_33_131]|jgi:NAD(P)H-nitrite reductase large subunit|uniref:NAD(P)/FAD-dependent oxidoreductase n=1 Tax=Formosa sp. Hel1_33_131 TaxID=1336794 RepID=UPI00084E188C|nr:FAD-dependent oxidoreductase [Formosa sp. Hel1_33_131]AOR27905.1 NADH dehydrogenase [Formosa sp. Hel1_33_131]
MEHIAIIGNGISGITAARHIRKLSNKKITVISSETDYFFSRTALMYVYMGHMKFKHTQPYENWFWDKNDITLKKGFVQQIDTVQKTLVFSDGEQLAFDKLIIATGSKPNKFGWPGQDLKGVVSLYHKQDLDAIETHAPNNTVCKRAVIVGGGLIGIELAEMFHSRHISVTFLVRENSYWSGILPSGESEMINNEIRKNGIDLRLESNLKQINANADGTVKSIVITETGEEIDCDVVGLTAGVSPNIGFLENSNIETNRGILVNRNLQTNIKDIYAIGDCAEQRTAVEGRRPIEAVWYTGRIMGETVAQTICKKETLYTPGHWFNSAKFFDIEYQTYGWVNSEQHKKPNEAHFHWMHPDQTKCLTLAFDKTTQAFLGINTFGIRMRHEIFNRWLDQNKTIDYVLEHLEIAHFDPEFYKNYYSKVIEKYNVDTNRNLQLKKKNWSQIFTLKY